MSSPGPEAERTSAKPRDGSGFWRGGRGRRGHDGRSQDDGYRYDGYPGDGYPEPGFQDERNRDGRHAGGRRPDGQRPDARMPDLNSYEERELRQRQNLQRLFQEQEEAERRQAGPGPGGAGPAGGAERRRPDPRPDPRPGEARRPDQHYQGPPGAGPREPEPGWPDQRGARRQDAGQRNWGQRTTIPRDAPDRRSGGPPGGGVADPRGAGYPDPRGPGPGSRDPRGPSPGLQDPRDPDSDRQRFRHSRPGPADPRDPGGGYADPRDSGARRRPGDPGRGYPPAGYPAAPGASPWPSAPPPGQARANAHGPRQAPTDRFPEAPGPGYRHPGQPGADEASQATAGSWPPPAGPGQPTQRTTVQRFLDPRFLDPRRRGGRPTRPEPAGDRGGPERPPREEWYSDEPHTGQWSLAELYPGGSYPGQWYPGQTLPFERQQGRHRPGGPAADPRPPGAGQRGPGEAGPAMARGGPGLADAPYPTGIAGPGDAGLIAQGPTAEAFLTEATEAGTYGWQVTRRDRERRPAGYPGERRGPPEAAGTAETVPRSRVASVSLVRSSSVMAIGTLASRITGLLRTLVLVAALGQGALANSYNYANTMPNTIYNIAIGGILTSVIVPLLIGAAKRERDGGQRYDQRMFTLSTIALLAITVLAVLAAGPIARFYDPRATGDSEHVLVIFAYFFAPQIFFYGMSSLYGAILNARGHFASPMWTPVVNNMVVILVTGAYFVIAGKGQTPSTITPFEVRLLGIGTTLGIVAQTAAMIPSVRRVGFKWRPRFDFRWSEIHEIGRMSGWMLAYVLTTQVAFLVTSRVASQVEKAPSAVAVGAGFSAYQYAWLLFQLPYAIVAISVITALLPRMSANAVNRRFDLVRADFSTGVRLGSVIVVPASLILAVLGPPIAQVLLSWGSNTETNAYFLGLVFSVFSLGLVPYMLFQLLLRVYYALHDSKTPALIGVATMITNVAANYLALLLPPTDTILALAAGFGLSNVVGVLIAWPSLSRRMGGLGGHLITRSLVRMHAAAVPAALFALTVALLIGTKDGATFLPDKVAAGVIAAIGGGGAVLIYWMFAKATRLTELTDLVASVRSRLGR